MSSIRKNAYETNTWSVFGPQENGGGNPPDAGEALAGIGRDRRHLACMASEHPGCGPGCPEIQAGAGGDERDGEAAARSGRSCGRPVSAPVAG